MDIKKDDGFFVIYLVVLNGYRDVIFLFLILVSGLLFNVKVK